MCKYAIAYKNTEKQVEKSSSGGAYIAICYAFEKKFGTGNVSFYGATYDSELNVVHKKVLSADECSAFQGSKYVKSKCSQTFEQVFDDIENNKFVLFSGTPCQIYSLKNYIKKNGYSEEKLYTLDVICHGIPKVEVWDEYKKWLEKKEKSKMIDYSFRYKKEGWKAYPAYAKFENGKELINTADTSVFSKLHMLAYSITNACFNCQFSKEDRVSDITLGDYWGIEKIMPNIPYKNGISLILLNSLKGKEILDDLEGEVIEKIADKSYLKYQHNLNRPTDKPIKYKEFWNDFENCGFEYILKKYLNYGLKYKISFNIKKIIRKTPVIEQYRKMKNR